MLKTLAKLAFASGIIVWLLHSGKLDFGLIPQSLKHPWAWGCCLGLLFVQDIISALRWRLLLASKNTHPLPILSSIRITWIGLFFNSFLPGAVTGDLIKLVYAQEHLPGSDKTFLLTSALMDRILGLVGLLWILGPTSLLYYTEITRHGPQMLQLVHINFVLFAGSLAFVAALFLPQRMQQGLLGLARKIPLLGMRIDKTLRQVWLMGASKSTIIWCILISVLMQLINMSSFYAVSSPFYGRDIPLPYIFTFIPLGLISIAIPISPSGMGVGHVIFDKLFSFVGIEGGASFFNLYFLSVVLINSLGFFPYILSGKRHNLEETKKFGGS